MKLAIFVTKCPNKNRSDKNDKNEKKYRKNENKDK